MSYAGVALETGKDYTPWNAGLSASWQRPEANTHWAELMYDQGTIPFVHLMIDDDMESIAAGNHDAAIDEWLRALLRYQQSGRRMVGVLFPEMNGNWTPYGQEEPLNHSWFINSFRSIVTRATAMGISTEYVQWCFAPNDKGFPGDTLEAWYPGDEWCQIIGGSVYCWGGIVPDAPWLAPAEIIEPFVQEIRGFTERRIIITQTGSGLNDPRSPMWLSQLDNYLASSVEVDGAIYFSISEFEYGPGVHDWNDRMSSLQSSRPLYWFNQPEVPMPLFPGAVAAPTAATIYGPLPTHGKTNVALVYHTTETSTYPGFSGGDTSPHYVYDPRTREFFMAAEFEDGYVGTCAGHTKACHSNCQAFQLEMICYSNKDVADERDYRIWVGDLTDDNYKDLARFFRWSVDSGYVEQNVTPTPPGGWLYGSTSPHRMSCAEWDAFSGLTAHGAVAQNSHWDTGVLDLQRIYDLAFTDPPPIEPPPGGDVDYRTIKNVPDAQWARNVVDTMLCLNVITEGDGSDWEKPLKNGTIWNYLDRYTTAIQRDKIDNC